MIVIILGILGVIFGSFVNALVWRIHEQDQLGEARTKKAEKRRRDLSITKGRSMCPDCSHTLAAKDLVPILSWIWLHGACRYCRKPISWQYPTVELLTGVLFAVSYLAWPFDTDAVGIFQFAVWLIFIVSFVALSIYDLRWFMLPDRIVYAVTSLAVVEVAVAALGRHNLMSLWQATLGGAIIFGLFWILFQISKGKWIGGGDVKLAFALGLLAGTPLHAFMVIFFASLLGTVGSIPVLLKGRKGLVMHVPFGPYLLMGTYIVVLWGTDIVQWYKNLLMV